MLLCGRNWQTIAVKFLLSKQKKNTNISGCQCAINHDNTMFALNCFPFIFETYTIAMLNRKHESKSFRFDVCHVLPSTVLCVKQGDGKAAVFGFTELRLCLCCCCCGAKGGKTIGRVFARTAREQLAVPVCTHTMHMHARTVATVTLVDPPPIRGS